MTVLLEPAEMAQADALTIAAGTPGLTLMERAGTAVADAAARWPYPTRILVLCGPGNNGGDGFVAARILAQRGFTVRLALFGDMSALRGDAAHVAGRWRGAVERAQEVDFAACDLVIDALYGAGLARDLEGEARDLVERLAQSGRPIIAVDLPSGIDGRTGHVRGAAAPAIETVTFFRKKPGHLLMPGRAFCGRVRVADIGIADSVLDTLAPKAAINDPQAWGPAFPLPSVAGHKYGRGHAVVVSGGAWTAGAARLAARGALRAGAGLVTVACPESSRLVHAASYSALMARPMETAEDLVRLLADSRFRSVVVGPGLGDAAHARSLLEAAVGAERTIVVDADALTAYAGAPDALAVVLAPAAGAILTPHDGEFARLFDGTPDILDAPSKLERTRAAARRVGGVALLKGPDTVVAAPDGRATIAENAPPYLATAGAGDVLAGIAGGLLAQGMPVFEAASAAVWLHGEAAREAGPGLIADDLPDALRPVYSRLFADLEQAGETRRGGIR